MAALRLVSDVWDFAQREGLLAEGDRVVVAVSGGPDSLSLLEVLHRLAPAHNLRLTVAHVNHGLRLDAAADADFVRAEAARRGLAVEVGVVDVAAVAATEGQGIEAAARRLRYRFLAQVAQATGANRLAVAHTADDQAETVLMRLLRGSGLAGLGGMRPKVEMGDWQLERGESVAKPQSLVLVRPLLGTTRAEVETYCREQGLRPREDATNQDRHYLRNWVRHDVLPLLEQRNPNLRATLARTAEVLAGEHMLAEAAVSAAWERAVPRRQQKPHRVTFDRQVWGSLDRPTRRGLLRRGMEALRGALRDVDFAPLEAAARFGDAAASGQYCELPGRLRFKAQGDWLLLGESGALAATASGPRLDESGQRLAGWRLETEWLGPGQWEAAQLATVDEWEAYVDAGRVDGPLTVRARRRGERFQPLGLAGHSKKISDFMVDVRVPQPHRAGWPVVACGPMVVWLAGLRLDERFRVQPDTQAVLRLRFVRQEGNGT